MTTASPPKRYADIFNPADFLYASQTLTYDDINGTYAKLAGGETFVAAETFTGGLTTNAQIAFKDSSGNTIGQQYASGNNMVYNVANAAGASHIFQTQGNYILQSHGTNGVYCYKDLTVTGNLAVDTNVLKVDVVTNRVGVNVTNPGYNLHVSGSGYISSSCFFPSGLYVGGSTGAPLMLGASWDTSATSHSITSSSLTFLASNNWSGELKVFASDASAYIGTCTWILSKPGSTTVTATQGTKVTNLTTFTLTVDAGDTSLTVATSPSCKISWVFTGAL